MERVRPARPVMRYHGGKWRIASWIISHFPAHRIYCEPYGGAGSVLLRKPRSFAEVYNDLDDDVVNVFRVLRDPKLAAKLRRAWRLTPWARKEFLASYDSTEDPVERARRALVRASMSHGSTSRRRNRTGFRARSYKQRQTSAQDWKRWPDHVASYVERLRGVVIENREALQVIRQHDSPETLFYVDPPYPLDTRSSIRTPSERDRAYQFDLITADHEELAATLHQVRGMAIISTYPNELYDLLYAGWMSATKRTKADANATRTEMLLMSPRTAAALNEGDAAEDVSA